LHTKLSLFLLGFFFHPFSIPANKKKTYQINDYDYNYLFDLTLVQLNLGIELNGGGMSI